MGFQDHEVLVEVDWVNENVGLGLKRKANKEIELQQEIWGSEDHESTFWGA